MIKLVNVMEPCYPMLIDIKKEMFCLKFPRLQIRPLLSDFGAFVE